MGEVIGPEKLFDLTGNRRELHTSDRQSFKRCRRRWNWSSRLRLGLEPIGSSPAALWFGSGWHFALEDYHGFNRFGDPYHAFLAYHAATKRENLPPDAPELLELAEGMLAHYTTTWLPRRDEYQTFWLNGVPQLEVPFEIYFGEVHGYEVWDSGTFDGIVTDGAGRLYVKEYKTAKKFDTDKLDLDQQVSDYVLAAQAHYKREFEGVVYMQFLKKVGEEPTVLKKGGLSVNKEQYTTHAKYRAKMIELYGTIADARAEEIEFLNFLAGSEEPEGDRFIRRDIVRRNQAEIVSAHQAVLDEAHDILDPNLKLYKNATRDCAWDCSFKEVCIATDDGSDPENMLANMFQPRLDITDNWRSRIQWPKGAQK